jgi:hypothetical protein
MKSVNVSVFMAALILVGISAPLAAAQGTINITRSNTQTQSNVIEQEACTNEQEDDAENQEGDDDQVAIAAGGNQSNDCVVVQNATASNSAAIVDLSDNDINASLANLDLEELIALGDL